MLERVRSEVEQRLAIRTALRENRDELDAEEAEQLLIDSGRAEPLNWYDINHELIESTLEEPWNI